MVFLHKFSQNHRKCHTQCEAGVVWVSLLSQQKLVSVLHQGLDHLEKDNIVNQWLTQTPLIGGGVGSEPEWK